MRIGIIVDGVSEYQALRYLIRRIDHPHTVLPIVKADLQPRSLLPQLVSRVTRAIQNSLALQKPDRVIVLLDLDGRVSCAVAWATELTEALQAASERFEFEVIPVIKNACFENWLVADPQALNLLNDFATSAATRSAIRNAADNTNALELLSRSIKAAAPGRYARYRKVEHSVQIMRVADPAVIARNSRSFRRFLRLIEHPAYIQQSKRPV